MVDSPLQCFGDNGNGQCSVPEGLAPVMASGQALHIASHEHHRQELETASQAVPAEDETEAIDEDLYTGSRAPPKKAFRK